MSFESKHKSPWGFDNSSENAFVYKPIVRDLDVQSVSDTEIVSNQSEQPVEPVVLAEPASTVDIAPEVQVTEMAVGAVPTPESASSPFVLKANIPEALLSDHRRLLSAVQLKLASLAKIEGQPGQIQEQMEQRLFTLKESLVTMNESDPISAQNKLKTYTDLAGRLGVVMEPAIAASEVMPTTPASAPASVLESSPQTVNELASLSLIKETLQKLNDEKLAEIAKEVGTSNNSEAVKTRRALAFLRIDIQKWNTVYNQLQALRPDQIIRHPQLLSLLEANYKNINKNIAEIGGLLPLPVVELSKSTVALDEPMPEVAPEVPTDASEVQQVVAEVVLPKPEESEAVVPVAALPLSSPTMFPPAASPQRIPFIKLEGATPGLAPLDVKPREVIHFEKLGMTYVTTVEEYRDAALRYEAALRAFLRKRTPEREDAMRYARTEYEDYLSHFEIAGGETGEFVTRISNKLASLEGIANRPYSAWSRLWGSEKVRTAVLAAIAAVGISEPTGEASTVAPTNEAVAVTIAGVTGGGSWTNGETNQKAPTSPILGSTIPTSESPADTAMSEVLPPLATAESVPVIDDAVPENTEQTTTISEVLSESEGRGQIAETDSLNVDLPAKDGAKPSFEQPAQPKVEDTMDDLLTIEGETVKFEYSVEANKLPEQYYRSLITDLETFGLPTEVLERNANIAWDEFSLDKSALKASGLGAGTGRVFVGDKVSIKTPVEKYNKLNAAMAKELQLPRREMVLSTDNQGISDVILRAFAKELAIVSPEEQKEIIAKAYANFALDYTDVATILGIEGGNPDKIIPGDIINLEPFASYLATELISFGMAVDDDPQGAESEPAAASSPSFDMASINITSPYTQQPVTVESMTSDIPSLSDPTYVQQRETISALGESVPTPLTPETYPGGTEAFNKNLNRWMEEKFGIRIEEKGEGFLASVFNPGPANAKILDLSVGELTKIAQIDNESELRAECAASGFTPECLNKLYAFVVNERLAGRLPSSLNDETNVALFLSQLFLREEAAARGTS